MPDVRPSSWRLLMKSFFNFCHPTVFTHQHMPPGSEKTDVRKYSVSSGSALDGNRSGESFAERANFSHVA